VEPDRSALLLVNGEVIEGRITRVGDRYHVVLPTGEIRIKASDVQFHCASVEEVYRHRRATMHVGRVEEHLELAAWCHRYGLLDQAARELDDAAAAEPRHPRIPLLRRRIELALHPPQTSTSPVVPVSQPEPSEADLDRLVRSMPPGTVETFTRTIQPLLVHGCAAAECHGPRSENRFRLLRTPVGHPPSRRLTQRNLFSTIQCVDPDQPDASPLLTAPVHPHGTAKEPIFIGPGLAHYRELVQWVRQAAARDAGPGDPASVPSEPEPVPQLPAMPAPLATPDATRPTTAFNVHRPAAVPQRSVVDLAFPDREQVLKPVPRVQRGADIAAFQPADPFDAEVFNRQFRLNPEQRANPSASSFRGDFSPPPEDFTPPNEPPPDARRQGTNGYFPAGPEAPPSARPSASEPTRPRPDWGEGEGPGPASSATRPGGPSRG